MASFCLFRLRRWPVNAIQRVALLVISLLMAAQVQARVNAENYQQFWLWAAVKPQPVLNKASTLYVLQGQIDAAKGGAVLVPQGPTVMGPVRAKNVWLAYRVHSLKWNHAVLASVLAQLSRWQQVSTTPVGIQLDFDARTYQLEQYAQFLTHLRKQLPAQYKLSITGLLDWTKTGDVKALNNLQGTLDELVVQTYRGTHSVPNYAEYLQSLHSLAIPFKVGLVQGGEWDAAWQQRLASSDFYRGEVIFLVNPAR
ncbi:DUF3142 domain-containing protein [Pokkaliibacter sp. CJK22405]|uniref:DUF3142 domain-containing protein n=1 Tax=Pokkaliibacter sp. CJK22405 TaxID=3384615 RepID=UPI0039851569